MTACCSTVDTLQRIAAASRDPHLARAAAAALGIIEDVRHTPLTPTDVECLHQLVEAIHRDGRLGILDHLHDDAPDCQVCAALLLKISEIERRSAAGHPPQV